MRIKALCYIITMVHIPPLRVKRKLSPQRTPKHHEAAVGYTTSSANISAAAVGPRLGYGAGISITPHGDVSSGVLDHRTCMCMYYYTSNKKYVYEFYVEINQ